LKLEHTIYNLGQFAYMKYYPGNLSWWSVEMHMDRRR